MKKNFIAFVFTFFMALAAFAAAPTASGSNLTFSSIDGRSFNGSFTAGNGSQRLIVVREGSAVTGLPVNGTQYTPSSAFGTAGSEFSVPGEYVVQSSGWSSFSVSNLRPGTVYYIAVFEFNGSGANTEYLMLPLTGNRMTVVAPTVQTSNITSGAVVGNSLTLNWTKGNGAGRIVLARKGAPVNSNPADLSFYYSDESFGAGTKIGTDNYVVYRGGGTSVTVKNLEPNSAYHFAVFEYNGSNTPVYLGPGEPASFTTHTGPTVASSAIGFNWVEGNRFTIACTQGNGAYRLFIVKKGSPVTASPVNGTQYIANAVFGLGQEIAPGEFVAGATAGNSVALTNLEANTTYHFRIFDYDMDKAGNTYYLTGSFAAKSGSTATIPTTLASSINVISITGSNATVGLTNGSGTYRTVIMKEDSPVDAAPSNFTTYSGNSNFGSGAQLGIGNYVVTWGMNGSPFTVNNLKPGKTYHGSIFEFNGNSYPVYSTSGATFQFSIPLEPTVISKTPLIQFREGGSFRLNWTNGNGARHLVIARKGSAPVSKPVDGTSYTANASFGLGQAIAADEFVVYNNATNYFDVKNLEAASTYHFTVFEFNVDENGNPDYLTSSWMSATGTTLGYPTTQVTISGATAIQSTQATINFTKGNGEGRLFFMKESTAIDTLPADYRKYNHNTYGTSASHIGGGVYVVYSSTGNNSFLVTNLKPKTTYHLVAFEYNGTYEPAYLRTAAPTYSFTTADVPGATTPTTAASNGMVTGADGNKFTFKWTNGNGDKRIVVMRKNVAVDFVPSDATVYAANAAFGSGTDLGGGQYVVYNSNGSSVELTNLLPSTEYHFAVYEYNGSGTLLRYLTNLSLKSTGSTVSAPATSVSHVNSVVDNNSVTLNWTNGNGAGRIIVMKKGSAVTASPVDLSVYPANAVFGNGSQVALGEYVIYAGAASSAAITGLTNGTYHYSIFEYNGSSAPVYNVANAVSGTAVVSSTLPVSLGGFSAKENIAGVSLEWSTLQEAGSSHFIIERSYDGVSFHAIKTVQAAGSSSVLKQYNYTDVGVRSAGKIYYRLKQVDKNERFVYSDVRVVDIKNHGPQLEIYPNPVVSDFKLRLPSGVKAAQLFVFNSSGMLVMQRKVTDEETIIATQLSKGLYTVMVNCEGKKSYTKMVKH